MSPGTPRLDRTEMEMGRGRFGGAPPWSAQPEPGCCPPVPPTPTRPRLIPSVCLLHPPPPPPPPQQPRLTAELREGLCHVAPFISAPQTPQPGVTHSEPGGKLRQRWALRLRALQGGQGKEESWGGSIPHGTRCHHAPHTSPSLLVPPSRSPGAFSIPVQLRSVLPFALASAEVMFSARLLRALSKEGPRPEGSGDLAPPLQAGSSLLSSSRWQHSVRGSVWCGMGLGAALVQ